MSGFLLHVGATVTCLHGGQAQPLTPNPRVQVSGQAIVTLSCSYTIAGCPFVLPPPTPCVSAQWVTGATRVKASGVPVILQDSQAVCVPNGTGLLPVATQVQVKGI